MVEGPLGEKKSYQPNVHTFQKFCQGTGWFVQHIIAVAKLNF